MSAATPGAACATTSAPFVDYSKAIDFAGDWPEAYRDRGYLYHLLARHEQARADFNRALKLNSRDAEA